MSRKLCKPEDGLEERIRGRKMKYRCGKCDMISPKEKWCCKPKHIKQ